MIHVDVRILHKRFPGKYDHIESDRVAVTADDLGVCLRELSYRPRGAGTELTKIIAWMGLTPAPGCKCKKRARYMDKMGCDWCEQNVETICDWLGEESAKRKLPFVRLAGKAIIHLAIRRAKKSNKK